MRSVRVFTVSAAVAFMFMSSPQASYATPTRGPHGGELRKAVGIPSSASFELVVKSTAQGKEIHVYGVDAQTRNVNLRGSGYGGIVFKMGDVELPLSCDKVDEQGQLSNADDRIEHYRAVGKFPSSADVVLEITIAFPSKGGTGKASFRPFANQDDSWR